mgnify:CR=1 FL=1
MSTLRIKILEDGLKPLYEKRVNVEGDAGVDLYFPKEVNIPAKSLGLIVSLGIKGEMVQSVRICLIWLVHVHQYQRLH